MDTLVLVGLPGEARERATGHDAMAIQDRGDELLESESRALDAGLRDGLVRLAALSAAGVEVVEGHEALEHAGGVGALLRYQP